MGPMRILHLDAGREMRGGQWQVLRLAEGLRAAGWECLLLARGGSPLYENARRRGLDARSWSVASVAGMGPKADIVHAHDGRSHTLAACFAARRLVVSRRVAFPIQHNPASRWKYGRAVHYIAVSEFVRRMLESYGIAGSRISVVYDGVPAAESRIKACATGPVVAPETDDLRKGTALALEAAKLAGVRVRLSRDLEKDLDGAAVFVYITHAEGLGSAVLMAMAAGVPVVASNIGGLAEIIDHGRTGLLTENTPQAIAHAMRRLMEDAALARSMADQARQVVQEKFSLERMVAGTIRVYEALL